MTEGVTDMNELNLDECKKQLKRIESYRFQPLLLDKEVIGIVYFGRDSCPNCAVFNDALRLILDELPDLKIYKFDTDFWRENIQYNEVLDLYGIDQVPMLIYISEDKTIQTLFDGEKTVQEIYESILDAI